MFKRPMPRKRGVTLDDVKYAPYIRVQKKPKVTFIKPIADLHEYLVSMKYHGATDEELEILKHRNTWGDALNKIVTYYPEESLSRLEYKKPYMRRLPVQKVTDVWFDYEVIDGYVHVSVTVPLEEAFMCIKNGKSVSSAVKKRCLERCRIHRRDTKRVRKDLERVLSVPVFRVFKKV
jgi:hypothetical protein